MEEWLTALDSLRMTSAYDDMPARPATYLRKLLGQEEVAQTFFGAACPAVRGRRSKTL